MIQTSCSELLVDTQIHDPKEALEKLSTLMKSCNWESSPPLTLELLKQLKDYSKDRRHTEPPEIIVYDKDGNRAFLEYGSNRYLDYLGYRFDSQCNHCDSSCYPIFDKAMELLQGELIACDGGSKGQFESWKTGIPEEETL